MIALVIDFVYYVILCYWFLWVCVLFVVLLVGLPSWVCVCVYF